MFARLLSHPGVRQQVELRSSFGFLAFHGGSLERFTDDIAEAAAREAGASYYGVIQPAEFRWHIPSNRVDPAVSPELAAFLEHVRVAVAIHGFGRADLFTSLLLGGSNRSLARHVGDHLRSRLGHYDIVDDLERVPSDLRGLHPDNPVNRPPEGGVQLELPPRVRGMGPYWHGWRAPTNPHRSALVAALAAAATTWSGDDRNEDAPRDRRIDVESARRTPRSARGHSHTRTESPSG
jgi:phage replication-related protein YjqB (UPF0714/DUF867 family)